MRVTFEDFLALSVKPILLNEDLNTQEKKFNAIQLALRGCFAINPDLASLDEQLAVNAANYLQQKSDAGEALTEESLIAFKLLNQYLETKILACNDFEEGELTNFYYQHYLTQLSRFRGQQKRDEAGLNVIKSLENALLPAMSLEVKIEGLAQEKIFTDAFEYSPEETGNRLPQYHYAKKTTPKGKKHQNEPAYYNDNKAIGSATQLSNLFGTKHHHHSHRDPKLGQDIYFTPADVVAHDQEEILFLSAQNKIKQGKKLSGAEKHVAQHGHYYRINSPVKFKKSVPENAARATKNWDVQIQHVSHASELITIQGAVPLTVSIDPIHYQSGTDDTKIKFAGIELSAEIKDGAKKYYDRQTQPAIKTNEYPNVDIVLISHNHHDHLCPQTLQEAYAKNPNTIFIVPVGDKKHMERFGFKKNVIEFNSWNDARKVTLKNGDKQSEYIIRAFPANHASNRSTDDFYESLYMGYMIEDPAKKTLMICTGDTGVLSEEHFNQLESYVIKNQLTIATAAIAHGPDRPRAHMEITHQSTADAVAMHARFSVINYKSQEARGDFDDSKTLFEQLKASACYGIGYHQGCYRLGLLSLSDVPSTLTRMLAVLENLKDVYVDNLELTQLKNSVFYAFLDDFEKVGLINLIKTYKNLNAPDDQKLTLGNVKEIVETYLNIPAPGARADLSKEKAHEGFKFDYLNLINNRDPSDQYATGPHAYEYFARNSNPISEETFTDPQQLISFFRSAIKAYERSISRFDLQKQFYVDEFIAGLDAIRSKDIKEVTDTIDQLLLRLSQQYFKPSDETIRNEDYLHTFFIIGAGILRNLGNFRAQFQQRQESFFNNIQDDVVVSDNNNSASRFHHMRTKEDLSKASSIITPLGENASNSEKISHYKKVVEYLKLEYQARMKVYDREFHGTRSSDGTYRSASFFTTTIAHKLRLSYSAQEKLVALNNINVDDLRQTDLSGALNNGELGRALAKLKEAQIQENNNSVRCQ